MDKLKDNLFELFLFFYSLRSFIVGPTLSDALIAISLVLSIVYIKYYLKKDDVSNNKELQDRLDVIYQEVAKLKLDQSIKKVGNSGFRS